MKKDTVEYILSDFNGLKCMFADRLFALLLQYGIDLRRMQIECGVYLKSYFLITDYGYYVGSIELAKKYLDALPPLPREESDTEPNKGGVEASKLPSELDTTKAKKKPTAQKQKGRKAKPLIDYFLKDTKQDDCNRIKALCDGRQGKDLALVILVAIQEGTMSKPTFRTIEKECNNVGSESGFSSYMHKGLKAYTKEEFEGMKKLLSQ